MSVFLNAHGESGWHWPRQVLNVGGGDLLAPHINDLLLEILDVLELPVLEPVLVVSFMVLHRMRLAEFRLSYIDFWLPVPVPGVISSHMSQEWAFWNLESRSLNLVANWIESEQYSTNKSQNAKVITSSGYSMQLQSGTSSSFTFSGTMTGQFN